MASTTIPIPHQETLQPLKEASLRSVADVASPRILSEDVSGSVTPPPVIKAPRARPLLAGVAKPKRRSKGVPSPIAEENSDSANGTEAAKKGRKTKKKATRQQAALEQAALQAATSQVQDGQAMPRFTFSFRFLNYNMAAKTGLSLDDVGSGFASLRSDRESKATTRPTARTLRLPTCKSGKRITNSESLQQVSLSALMTGGAETMEDRLMSQTLSDDNRVSRKTAQNPAVSTTTAAPPKKSVQFDEAASEGTSTTSSIDEAPTRPLKSVATAKTTATMATTATTATTATRRSKKKTFMEAWTSWTQGIRPSKRSEVFERPLRIDSTNVDCVFGALSETQFPMEEYAKSFDLEGPKRVAHFHCHSAMQNINAQGVAAAAKGKVVGKIAGDLKSFMLYRSILEEIEDGKIFCSFDEDSTGVNKGNPIKSFIGETFDGACGAVRFVLLGTHLPMQKLSSMMEDTTNPPELLLQKMKCLMARLLQKILRHLLQRGVLNANTMVILQGDLNSRCVSSEGKYVDLLWETLQDQKLQKFMCMDLPLNLQGEWKEVVPCPDPGKLQATYRFQEGIAPTAPAASTLTMDDLYGKTAEDAPEGYRQVLETLQSNGTLQDWALFGQIAKDDKAKEGRNFKASRLPAATERVLYYAPSTMMDNCRWEAPRGYEVNYLHLGSDHKPVMLEATLIIGGTRVPAPSSQASPREMRASQKRGSQVPDNFELELLSSETSRIFMDTESDSDSPEDNTFYDSATPGNFLGKIAIGVSTKLRSSVKITSRRMGMRLSLQGPLND